MLGGLIMVGDVVRRHRLTELSPSFTAETILDTLAEPVLVVDREGIVRFASIAASTRFGWDGVEGRSWRALAVDDE